MVKARCRTVGCRRLRQVFRRRRMARAAVEVFVRAAVMKLFDCRVAGKASVGVELLRRLDDGGAGCAPGAERKGGCRSHGQYCCERCLQRRACKLNRCLRHGRSPEGKLKNWVRKFFHGAKFEIGANFLLFARANSDWFYVFFINWLCWAEMA